MASLNQRLLDLLTAVGGDVKLLRTYITGSSTGDLSGLTTTAKTSIIAAINEVKASATGAPPDATEAAKGVGMIATQAKMTAGTDDLSFVTPLKHRVDSDARYQPKDTDLDAIAALTTTAYGRSFLALANQAGLQALLGLDTDVTLASNSDVKIATQKAVKAYADGLLDANNAYVYKGALDASLNPNYPAGNAGHTYKITVAGRLGGAAGPVVEVGDTATLLVDGSAAGTHATVGANWLITQTNIDGAVVGPATSVAGNIVTFSGTTGKMVQDSTIAISIDGTMAANSDLKVPTEKAVRTYTAANFYTKTELGNPDADLVAAYTAAKA